MMIYLGIFDIWIYDENVGCLRKFDMCAILRSTMQQEQIESSLALFNSWITIDQNDDEGDCEDDHDYDIKDDKDDVVRALQINGSSLPFERISITNQKRV